MKPNKVLSSILEDWLINLSDPIDIDDVVVHNVKQQGEGLVLSLEIRTNGRFYFKNLEVG